MDPSRRLTWQEVCTIVACWHQQQMPGQLPTQLAMKYPDGREIPLPFVPAAPEENAAIVEQEPWGPTALQEDILEALDGRALRAEALAAKVGKDKSQLYKAGGLKELTDRGLVKSHSRAGYYRPDAPPADLSG